MDFNIRLYTVSIITGYLGKQNMKAKLVISSLGFALIASFASAGVSPHGGALTRLSKVSSVGNIKQQQLS